MRVGFIGLGAMGWPMAANIIKGGHELIGFDADPQRLARFAAEVGGTAAKGLTEVAGAEVVVTMLPTSKVVRQALMAKDVKIAADLGRALGLNAPISRLVSDRLNQARDAIGADRDNSAAFLAWEKDMG